MLAALQPSLLPGEYVFCCVTDDEFETLEATRVLASFREVEGVTALLEQGDADTRGLGYHGVFTTRGIPAKGFGHFGFGGCSMCMRR